MVSGELRGAIERSVRSFARHEMTVYATALAYRGLFALFPFAIFLVAVVSFLRVDAVLGWLAEQGPPGIRGEIPQPIASLLEEAFGQDHGWLLLVGIALAFWSVSISALFLTKALNAVFEVQETRPPWKRIASSLTFAPSFAPSLALAAVTRDPHARHLQGGVARRMGGPRRGVRPAMNPSPLAYGAPPAHACRGGRLPLRPR